MINDYRLMLYKKLEEKLDYTPKHFVYQTKQNVIPIWSFNLLPYLNNENIKNFIIENKNKLKYKHDWPEAGNIFHNLHTGLLPKSKNVNVDLEKLFSLSEEKVTNIWPKLGPFHKNYSFILLQYLLAVYNKNDSIDWHDHGITELVGTYYVEVPENSANIVFENNDKTIEVNVKTGMLLLFPGHAKHTVYPSQHEGERIIVTMNFWRNNLLTLGERE